MGTGELAKKENKILINRHDSLQHRCGRRWAYKFAFCTVGQVLRSA